MTVNSDTKKLCDEFKTTLLSAKGVLELCRNDVSAVKNIMVGVADLMCSSKVFYQVGKDLMFRVNCAVTMYRDGSISDLALRIKLCETITDVLLRIDNICDEIIAKETTNAEFGKAVMGTSRTDPFNNSCFVVCPRSLYVQNEPVTKGNRHPAAAEADRLQTNGTTVKVNITIHESVYERLNEEFSQVIINMLMAKIASCSSK